MLTKCLRNKTFVKITKGTNFEPPLCKGRWHFRKKMTEGLALSKKIVRTNPSVTASRDSSPCTGEPFFCANFQL